MHESVHLFDDDSARSPIFCMAFRDTQGLNISPGDTRRPPHVPVHRIGKEHVTFEAMSLPHRGPAQPYA